MRIAPGKVVDGRVELDAELPEEASVTVLALEGDETFEADPETEKMLLEAVAQCRQGHGLPARATPRDDDEEFAIVATTRLAIAIEPSATFVLNRLTAFAAMARATDGPAVQVKPRNVRSCGRATALFDALTVSLSRVVRNRVTRSITR